MILSPPDIKDIERIVDLDSLSPPATMKPKRIHYKTNINDVIYAEDSYRMWKVCKNDQERLLVSVLWLFGPRVMEALVLKKEDIQVNDDSLLVRFPTLKLGAGFYPNRRKLMIKRSPGIGNGLYIEFIIEYSNTLLPSDKLFLFTKRWAEKVIGKISLKALGKPLSPMHFRHSRMTHMGASGTMGAGELKYWKGSKNISSVNDYLAARAFELNMEEVNDQRDLSNNKAVRFVSEREIERSYEQPSETRKKESSGIEPPLPPAKTVEAVPIQSESKPVEKKEEEATL